VPFLLLVLLLLALAPSVAAAQEIHAHRGGSVLAGVPSLAEETMPAFRHAWLREGAVLELDVKLTSDRVPVVIHDDTLDRTTTCDGPVSGVDLAAFRACKGDVLGSGAKMAPAPQPVDLATLEEVLAFARSSGASVNLEIKNLPNDNDFDPTSGYANTVMDAVLASGLPKERVIVQSFYPPNLDVAEQRMPGVALSLLTLPQSNEGAPEFAQSRGYEWISPAWPIDAGLVERAHGYGLKVVPYTIDAPADVQEAARIGVDALITDDPVTARRALGRPDPPEEGGRPKGTGGAGDATLARGQTASLARDRRSLRRTVRSGWITVRVWTTAPARVALRGRGLRPRTRAVRAGTTRVGVRLTKRSRRALRQRRAATLRVTGRAVFASGEAARLRLAVRLRR